MEKDKQEKSELKKIIEEITEKPHKRTQPKPLTLQEIHLATQKRLSLIHKEFSEGFEFIKKYQKSVTFFGGAKTTSDNPYYIKARELSKKIVAELGYTVVSGGGPGIMEAANRGAFEMGGKSIGINIELPHEQTLNPYITEHKDFYYFFTRKVCLSFSAEAFIFFPGGFGTMDELLELITLVQTKKIPKVPIILVGSDFWNEFDSFVKKTLLSRGNIEQKDSEIYTIEDDEEK